MKKILLWIIFLWFLFLFYPLFADTRDAKTIDQEIQKVKEDKKSANGSTLDALEEKEAALEEEKKQLSSWWWKGCKYSEWVWLGDFLNGCKPETVVGWWTMTIEGWFKDKINDWIANIALVLWVGAVGALVYAALLLQFANGEDEKIKKSKDIIKWTMIGFIMLISASGMIYVVINVMFWLWWE